MTNAEHGGIIWEKEVNTMKKTVMNSGKITIYLSPEIMEKLRTAAEEKGATTSCYVRMVVMEHLRKSEN